MIKPNISYDDILTLDEADATEELDRLCSGGDVTVIGKETT